MTTTPRLIPDRLTPCSPADVYAALERAWIAKFDAQPRRESLLVLVSQWAEETGWGKSCHCWNIGNAKHVEGDGRSFCFFRCSEVIDGREVWFDPPSPACCFRAFDTLDEGVADYLELLWHRFSKSWGAVLAGDPAGFARALKAQGYYTAAEPLYETALVSIYAHVGKLVAGDAVVEPAQCWNWRRVQVAINDLGYQPPLHVDNEVGPLTRAGVRWVQARAGLPLTGIADDSTVQALRGDDTNA